MKQSLRALAIIVLTALVGVLVSGEEGETVEDRLQPFGNICLEGDDCGGVQEVAVVSNGRSGKEVYDAHCFACHATGVSEAPLVGAEDWQVRLAEKGEALMFANTKTGFNVVMPPMGTCMNCSDDELKAAITYLIEGE